MCVYACAFSWAKISRYCLNNSLKDLWPPTNLTTKIFTRATIPKPSFKLKLVMNEELLIMGIAKIWLVPEKEWNRLYNYGRLLKYC